MLMVMVTPARKRSKMRFCRPIWRVARAAVLILTREIHREQLSIEHSMRDLDSAVGRLDNILISLYVFICFIVIAVVLVRAGWAAAAACSDKRRRTHRW
jgi:hypothetical protein